MKKLITTLTLLSALYSSATLANGQPQFPLIENDIALEVITEGEVTQTRALCPEEGTCIVDGTIVTVKLPLNGCLDRLGPVTYTVEQEDGFIFLHLSAYNIANSDSFAAFCFKMPEVTVDIQLINMYGPVQIDFQRPVNSGTLR
ncbi:MAG: hypothetical protein NXH75_03735 [Halobacteriovoraceae bacterium]|nr:hypothetical protein [Halobacteriovoraceae bacterium]